MRVILDTNIYISYLLTSGQGYTISQVVESCLVDGTIELIVPPELIEEFRSTIAEKQYLSSRIHSEDVDDLIETLSAVAQVLPPLTDILPLSRDSGDDYLLAHALAEEVDVLVTGDGDLLDLPQIGRLKILSATQFWQQLLTGS